MRRHDPGLRREMVSEAIDTFDAVERMIADERFGARLTVVAGEPLGGRAVMDADRGIVAGDLPAPIRADALADAATLLDRELPATLTYDGVDVFIEPLVPRPRLIIFGAVHIAQALSSHASLLGFHVTVSDARASFITPERFPAADDLAVGWPDQIVDRVALDRRASVVVLSHDARFEEPLWPLLLPTPVRYIGAMGSKRTAARRRERLLAQGFDEATVDRIHGPIGLDIGADTPGEVAVAILGQIISEHRRPHEKLDLVGERRPLAPA